MITTDRMAGIRRVDHADGSHVEPALDPSWPRIDRLRWRAAVTHHDSDIDVGVTQDGDEFTVRVGRGSSAPFTFDEAWYYIVGAGNGADEITQEMVERVHEEMRYREQVAAALGMADEFPLRGAILDRARALRHRAEAGQGATRDA